MTAEERQANLEAVRAILKQWHQKGRSDAMRFKPHAPNMVWDMTAYNPPDELRNWDAHRAYREGWDSVFRLPSTNPGKLRYSH